MPVYVRRRQAVTPDTLGEFSTDEEDFVTDPDQTRDLLPQPFRMITKLLDAAIDDIWQNIAERENERLTEQRRQLPPQYSSGGPLEVLRRVTCLCCSPDNEFVFVGMSDGVAAIRSGQHASGPVDVWQTTEFDLTSLQCSQLSDGVYILAANDDVGVTRLFAFAGERFLLLKIMNDTEGDKKVIASKVDLSPTTDYCGLALENPGSGETWLEVHRLPRDAWVKELDGVVNSRRQAAAKRAAAQEEAGAEDGATQRSATASPVEEDRTSHKFSAPTLVLRCRPPPKISGTAATTLSAALKPVDGSGDVLGSGTNHPLTSSHLEARQAVFETLHEQQLRQMPAPEEEPQRDFQSPTWHFLANGRSLPFGLEQANNENGGLITAGVALWWRDGRHLLIFSLVRPAKEVEHRPEQLLPFASAVTASCASPCSGLLAVGLASGHVLLVDWHLGLTRRLLHVGPQPVWRLRFLGPLPGGATTEQPGAYPPYRDRVELHLLAVMADRTMFAVAAGPGNGRAAPQLVATSAKHPHERPAWVDAVPAFPGLVLRASHAGVLLLHDVVAGRELCRLTLPEDIAVAEPWQPQVCVPAGAGAVYVRGQRRARPVPGPEEGEPEPEAEEESESVLVALDLSHVKELARHLQRAPEKGKFSPAFVHPMMMERCNALLELRLKTHADRTAKLQDRWQRLQETFRSIQERKAGFDAMPVEE